MRYRNRNRLIARLYALWKEGGVLEAAMLQDLVAQAEKARKEGIAPMKFAAAHFAGAKADVMDPRAFWSREPYKPCEKEKQD